jgi:1-acyl-sn-glycerol-3-phosphate acyltransferase
MFPVTCSIWLIGIPFDKERRAVHRMVLFQGSFLSRSIPLWRLKVDGREKIEKNQAYVIISNHHSLLDILLLNRLGSRFRWVSKTENFKVPILGPTMRMAKYIEVVRGNKESVIKMMEESLDTLSKGISVMLFPEGTRSRSQVPGPFKTGAFQLALKAQKPILPVILHGTGTVLPKKGFRFSSGHRLLVKVLDPVYPESFGSDDPEVLAVEFRQVIASALENVSDEKLKDS